MPRARELPADDRLLAAGEACGLCKVSPSRWNQYSKRFPLLVRGRRLVQVTPGGRGTMRWLKSAIIAHIHLELAKDRARTPLRAQAVSPPGGVA